jgi:hypothetical protein
MAVVLPEGVTIDERELVIDGCRFSLEMLRRHFAHAPTKGEAKWLLVRMYREDDAVTFDTKLPTAESLDA